MRLWGHRNVAKASTSAEKKLGPRRISQREGHRREEGGQARRNQRIIAPQDQAQRKARLVLWKEVTHKEARSHPGRRCQRLPRPVLAVHATVPARNLHEYHITISKMFDNASIASINYCVNGTHIPEGIITCVKYTGEDEEDFRDAYLNIELTDLKSPA